MKLCTSLILVNVLPGSGCRSIGPKKVTRDRVDYSHSPADSWKRQPDPEFFQVLTLVLDVQDAGALGMKVTEPEEGQSAIHTIS